MKRAEIGILLRIPELGKGKTRLAKEVGRYTTYKIYRRLFNYNLNLLKQAYLELCADVTVYYQGNLYSSIDQGEFKWVPQVNGSLTDKLWQIAKKQNNQEIPGLIMGSDCCQIRLTDLNDALERLLDLDYILGPALDGGYYLFGSKKWNKAVFNRISWSTEAVCKQTEAQLKQIGATYVLLDQKRDIDFKQDLFDPNNLVCFDDLLKP